MRVSEVDGDGSETAKQKYFFKMMTQKILDRDDDDGDDDDDDDIGRIFFENLKRVAQELDERMIDQERNHK